MVYAQPLYVEHQHMKKARRNVVFVGTEAGTVYAFDADKPNGGSPLWTRFLVNTAAGETGPGVTLGVIAATPVIDVARRRMYVIGYLKNRFNNLFFRLHAIALKDGKDVVKPAVLDQNTIPQVTGTPESRLIQILRERFTSIPLNISTAPRCGDLGRIWKSPILSNTPVQPFRSSFRSLDCHVQPIRD